MTITYPLSLPNLNIKNITVRMVSTTAKTESPFTKEAQVYEYASGKRFEFIVELPPMKRAAAEEWIAFLAKLKGQKGTFYIGDPDGVTARGIATGTPLVNGASQTGGSLITDGWTTGQTGILKAGDYIQIGDYMYKNLSDVNSDGSGNATLDIWPDLRSSPANNAAITVSSCVTKCRLTSNLSEWSANEVRAYGLTFSCEEAL